jgi:hypothetical protein
MAEKEDLQKKIRLLKYYWKDRNNKPLTNNVITPNDK